MELTRSTIRNLIVALYVIVGIILSGIIPFLQPTSGLFATTKIILVILIGISLFKVWGYMPNGRTLPIFWGVFLGLIAVELYLLGFFNSTTIPKEVLKWVAIGILGISAFIIARKDSI